MKEYLFTSWLQWRVCFVAGVQSLAWGLWRIITCIVLGLLSILWYCIRQIEAFCKREPVAAAIIAVIILSLSIGWIVTYVNRSVELRAALDQRDSISIKLDRYLQAYESGKTLIVNGDTIRK